MRDESGKLNLKPQYSEGEIVRITGRSRSGIRKRAAQESWPFVEVCNSKGGGCCKLYLAEGLPEDVRAKVEAWEGLDGSGDHALVEDRREAELHREGCDPGSEGGAERSGERGDLSTSPASGRSGLQESARKSGEMTTDAPDLSTQTTKSVKRLQDSVNVDGTEGLDGVNQNHGGLNPEPEKEIVPDGSSAGAGLPAVFSPIPGEGVSVREFERALMAVRLTELYREHLAEGKASGRGKMAARETFALAYNHGELGVLPEIFRVIGKVSWKSLDKWDVALRKSGGNPNVLVDRRGKHRLGERSVTGRVAEILQTVAKSPNAPKISEVIRVTRARCAFEGIDIRNPRTGEMISTETLRAYVEEFRDKCYATWVFNREGQRAMNLKCSKHLERDYDRIEVGDILVADGHRLNFDILNPWTGQAQRMNWLVWKDMKSNYPVGWDIAPTENIESITLSLYRAILRLGKIPSVAYLDNGRAFRAKHFNSIRDFRQASFVSLFDALGIMPIYAWPYHGESKTVERFFGTFAELERIAPTFRGTNIETKPPRLNRGEKLHRKLYDAATGGRVPTLIEAYYAIAKWVDSYVLREQRGHLDGLCPAEVFDAGRGPGFNAEEAAKTRILLARQTIKTVPRDGLLMPWAEARFYHPALFGMQRQSVVVRYDWQDSTAVYVYDLEGNYICRATRREKVHPAARQLGTAEDVAELARQIEEQKRCEAEVMRPAVEFLKAVVLPDVVRQQQDAGFIRLLDGPKRAPASPVGPEREAPEAVPSTFLPEDAERIAREVEDLDELNREMAEASEAECEAPDEAPPDLIREPTVWERLQEMDELDRYEELLRMEVRGQLVPRAYRSFMKYFEETPRYRALQGYFDDLRVQLAGVPVSHGEVGIE